MGCTGGEKVQRVRAVEEGGGGEGDLVVLFAGVLVLGRRKAEGKDGSGATDHGTGLAETS